MSGQKSNIMSHSRLIAGICVIIFVALTYILLPGINADYLRRIEEQSFFTAGSTFFNTIVNVPGGLLAWVGAFLTQFFYHPWLGTSMLLVLLLCLWVVTARVFRLRLPLFPLAVIPSAMLLLSVLTPGYVIFTLKSPGWVFSNALGLLCSLGLFAAYRSLTPSWARGVLAVLTVCIGYPFIGFYALFAGALFILDELRDRRVWWVAGLTLVLIAAVPMAYFYWVPDNHLMRQLAYISGLPRYYANEPALWTPFIITFVFLALMVFVRTSGAPRQRAVITSAVAFVLAMVYVVTGRYTDENFDITIRMDRAITDGDYARAARVARGQKGRPTRVVGMLTHLALNRMGTAADSLFSYPMDAAEYNTYRPDMALRQTIARNVNYNYGHLNDAYRWCMEDMVEFGPRVEYLRYMAKCALLNGELDLARRYARMLEGTMFHKDEARTYFDYADNPESMKENPEFVAVKTLNSFSNLIGGDGALIETYISRSIAGMEGGPEPLVDLSLQFNLILKSIDKFWPRFFLYARSHQRIPRHYQEAAILFSTLEGKVDWRQFNIDPAVAQRFQRFMALAQQNKNLSEETNRELFKEPFGDTYWYYYFFTKGLKTT